MPMNKKQRQPTKCFYDEQAIWIAPHRSRCAKGHTAALNADGGRSAASSGLMRANVMLAWQGTCDAPIRSFADLDPPNWTRKRVPETGFENSKACLIKCCTTSPKSIGQLGFTNLIVLFLSHLRVSL